MDHSSQPAPIPKTTAAENNPLRQRLAVRSADHFWENVAGVSPDPVVTWGTEAAAKAFISSKSGDADFQAVAITDEAMDKMAQAMGCPVETLSFDPYPG